LSAAQARVKVVGEAIVPAEIHVLYFAAARELCGCTGEALAIAGEGTSVRAVLAAIAERHAPMRPVIDRMRVAVNGELVQGDAAIGPGDEVAVLPPVAGGASGAVAICALSATPLSVDVVLAAVRRAEAGGIAVFIGTVRDHADGKPVARLDYEAHPELAAREMQRVLEEVAREHPDVRVGALHRTGELAVGDVAVIVAASAPHRAEAFSACRAAIERIKERVPIWKKEWAPDGAAHWVNLEG
jgi:molybdopterin synthase catalytic subunit